MVCDLRYQPPFGTVCAWTALALVVFIKNPTNYTFFGSLIIPENDFIFKKRQKFKQCLASYEIMTPQCPVSSILIDTREGSAFSNNRTLTGNM